MREEVFHKQLQSTDIPNPCSMAMSSLHLTAWCTAFSTANCSGISDDDLTTSDVLFLTCLSIKHIDTVVWDRAIARLYTCMVHLKFFSSKKLMFWALCNSSIKLCWFVLITQVFQWASKLPLPTVGDRFPYYCGGIKQSFYIEVYVCGLIFSHLNCLISCLLHTDSLRLI